MHWQPTWSRLAASTLVLFALVLAVLVWRVEAGDDPALGASSASGGATGARSAAPAATLPGAADASPAPGVPNDAGDSASGPATHVS